MSLAISDGIRGGMLPEDASDSAAVSISDDDVLAAAQPSARHWLCLTIHHVNADHASLQVLRTQLYAMLASREARLPEPSFSFADLPASSRAQY